MIRDNTFAKLVVKRKIEQILNQNMYNGVDDFINQNPNISIFVQKNNLATILSHSNSNLTNEEYENILLSIKNEYKSKNNNVNETLLTKNDELEKTIVLPPIIEEKQEDVYSKQTQLVKKSSINNLKNGFIDAAILAFVTGSFFGALFINLYINIIRTM